MSKVLLVANKFYWYLDGNPQFNKVGSKYLAAMYLFMVYWNWLPVTRDDNSSTVTVLILPVLIDNFHSFFKNERCR